MPRRPLARVPLFHHAVAAVHAPSAHRLGIRTTLPSAGVAITFDDGPHPEGTPAVLEILAANHSTATFFVVGEQVDRHPELLRRIVDGGHEVGLHGYRHLLQSRRRSDDLREDYARGLAAIEDAAAITPTLHRPPYGVYAPIGLQLARHNRLHPLLWSVWGKDWRRYTTARRISARVTRGLGPGAVVLLHDADYYSARDSHRRTAAALELIYATLTSRGIATVLPDVEYTR